MRAVAARARGDEALARHFERRGEADWGCADGLRGQIAALKEELQLLTGGAAAGDELGAREPTAGR